VARSIGIALLAVALAGCGSGGLRGSLAWSGSPSLRAHSASGIVRNVSGHTVDLDPHALRLLDADGRKVAGTFSVARAHISRHETTRLTVHWRTGKPVRIDYGAGTLRLTSG
jgi:hypothetical protein